MNMISMLALMAGIAIFLGYRKMGGLMALTHAFLALIFTNNVWTPKTDRDQEISGFLTVTAEIFMSLIVLLDLRPEIPALKFKF